MEEADLIGKVPEGGVVMEGHEQLGAQQAVAGLLGAHIHSLTLLEQPHTQVHHSMIHLQHPRRASITTPHT